MKYEYVSTAARSVRCTCCSDSTGLRLKRLKIEKRIFKTLPYFNNLILHFYVKKKKKKKYNQTKEK